MFTFFNKRLWAVMIMFGVCAVPVIANAQGAQAYGGGGAVLARGLTQDEVKKRLGTPDDVRVSKSETQWSYGRSLIFFVQDAVVAWSDMGELAEREQLRTMSLAHRDTAVDFKDYGWTNAWRKEEPMSKAAVVDELTGDGL